MKIQERTGAGSGRSAAPVQPGVGERIPAPPRERKPALAALAVLLILVGALGATVLVLRAGDRIEVVKVTADIPAGEAIRDGNYTTVMVNDDSSAHFVEKSQIAGLKKLKAKSTIHKGTVVVGEMFGAKAALPAGKASVGLSLKEGQYPSDVKSGDTVAAYPVLSSTSTGKGSTGSGNSASGTPLVANAKVNTVNDKSDATVSTGNLNLTLLVPQEEVAALASAASEGKVVIVRVPSNGN
ncbi:hypothetical protein AB0H82_25875 [Streptomyces sp. NPDC050732]|uniref:SAF domain-containing protein n=1 Tax=Streptomyces sp. NPDC050732 TaxID=3154632 RepID=UPI003437CD97